MDAQKRVLLASIVGIVIVVAVMVVAGRYLFVEKVQPAVERVVTDAAGASPAGGAAQTDGGKSTVVTKAFPVESFRSLVVEGGWELKVSRGETPSVVISAPADAMKDVSVETQAGTVRISLMHEVNLFQGKLSASVVAPVLNRADLNGGVKADFEGFVEPSLYLSIAGAGSVTGSGNRIQNLTVKCAGAANVDLRRSRAVNAVVEVDGAGRIILNMAGGNLSGHLSGVGKVDYYGTVASQNVQLSGLGSVQAKGE